MSYIFSDHGGNNSHVYTLLYDTDIVIDLMDGPLVAGCTYYTFEH